MAEDAVKAPAGKPETKIGGAKLPDKSTNAHVSNAARLAPAPLSDKGLAAVRDEAQARQDESEAVQKAAPTGKDLPHLAAENIKGTQTAIAKPHQPRSMEEFKTSGAQLEPALVAKDGGSIPHAMVSSPTGLIPASVAGGAQALAQYEARLKQEKEGEDITEAQLLTMNKHEIRAAAHDRGYKIGEGSVRSLTRRFLEAQNQASTDATNRAKFEVGKESH